MQFNPLKIIISVQLESEYMPILQIQPLQCGDQLWSSESDACRRQILTSKVDPHTVRVKIFLMAVDP